MGEGELRSERLKLLHRMVHGAAFWSWQRVKLSPSRRMKVHIHKDYYTTNDIVETYCHLPKNTRMSAKDRCCCAATTTLRVYARLMQEGVRLDQKETLQALFDAYGWVGATLVLPREADSGADEAKTLEKPGGPAWARTRNPRLMRALLYP